MKTRARLLCILLTGLATAAPAAEHLWDNFDAYPAGSIANQPGWTRAAWLGTQTGQVSATFAYSAPHSLELPWHAAGSSAVYTNFASTYSPGVAHPVIRCSAKLFLQTTNTPFQIGLRNSAAGAFLQFQNLGGYGTLGFQYHDSVFVPLATNRFIDVTFFYNRSNNTYRLDVDHTNRLPWALADSDPVIHTQFNQFLVTRLTNTAGTTGAFLVDDVSVETFPPHVWAWWRCTSLPYAHFIEQLGTFPPGYRGGYGDTDRAGSADPVWDGSADVHNEGATRMLVAGPTPCDIATPSSTNWTIEAVVRMPPDQDNVCFLAWGKGTGINTNGSYVMFGYNQSWGALYYNLRDAAETNTTYDWHPPIAEFVPDGRWHHLALVKSNADVRLYVDYQAIATNNLSPAADGAYAFDTLSRATIGVTLNGGNTSGPDTVIDEIRFSGKALAPSEFLQPGQPLIVDIRGHALNNDPWPLTAKCILGKSYRLETSPVLGPAAAWLPIPGSAFTAANTFDFVDVPDTTPRANFVRLIRED